MNYLIELKYIRKGENLTYLSTQGFRQCSTAQNSFSAPLNFK